ncbi:MAG: aminotransferase class V-fold PLP-dependent enzyme, partial [Nocardioidaceae bacterium]
MRDAFDLDPSVVHLNHGSFGAVPRVVAEAQRRIRGLAAANPMRFHRVQSPHLKERARQVAGAFLGVGADEVALVRNITQAAATVLASIAQRDRLRRGDTVVLGEQVYASVRSSVVRRCNEAGASYDIVGYGLDASDDAVVAAFRRTFDAVEARGERVRLVIVDHIASPTGAVLPVRRICAAARDAGALSFVDAAHVPGQLPAG